MKALFFLIILLVVKTVNADVCPVDSNDPFSVELRVPGGPFINRCINSQNYRSVVTPSQEQLNSLGLTPKADEFLVANFRHLNKFWIARIPVEDVEKVVFQKMQLNKSLPMYHAQLRFVLKTKAIKLVSQTTDQLLQKTLELRESNGEPQDFIIALFGVRDIEHDLKAFNPLFGLQKKYAISYAFQSLYDGADWALEQKQTVQEFELKLSPEQQQKLIVMGRDYGDKKGISEMYHLLKNNCLNYVFTLLNEVVHGSPSIRTTKRFSETRLPIQQLKKLGLITDKKAFSRLELDYPQGVEKIEQ